MNARKFEIVNVMSCKPHHVNMISSGTGTSILICLICGILAVISTTKQACIVNYDNWKVIDTNSHEFRLVNIPLIANN